MVVIMNSEHLLIKLLPMEGYWSTRRNAATSDSVPHNPFPGLMQSTRLLDYWISPKSDLCQLYRYQTRGAIEGARVCQWPYRLECLRVELHPWQG